ncbi:ATP-binding protein [Streptomyces sp. NPDC013313]|uniref:sensor histidine kinase n=1 Tax=Streptomyces sp. NPDC013313 TaxID=3155603 RepID=UPI0033C4C091
MEHDPDARWLARVMHIAFFLLLGASLARFLLRHPWQERGPWIVALSCALAALYLLGPVVGTRATARRTAWLGTVVAVWAVLVLLAPSFAWCAVPLFYTGLRTLPPRAALALVALLTVFVVTAQVKLSHGAWDPNLLVAPPAVAAIATAVFVHARRQADRQRALIDDLIRARRELAATERREGTLAHVRTAESVAEHNLAEARRFVHDLAPAELAGGSGLEEALRRLAAREGAGFRVDGVPVPLPERVESALLRIAQGALANVREHAAAASAALTLTYLGDQVALDIADDGRGFEPGRVRSAGVRGHGLPAMRARVRRLGGTLTVESAPGEGTVLSAAVPLHHEESDE